MSDVYHAEPQKKFVRVSSYRRSNPPESYEVALARISELEVIVEDIGASIEFGDPQEFDTDEDFFDWKKRAIHALAWRRSELHFLNRWIKLPAQLNEKQQAALEGMASDIGRLVDLIRERYTPLYSEKNMPQQPSDAYKRISELGPLLSDCTRLFTNLKKQAKDIGLDNTSLSAVRQPLSSINSQIVAERVLLSQFLISYRVHP